MWLFFVIALLITLGLGMPSRKLYAKVKFTGLISEIRGQLHNTIIQGWKAGVFSVKGMMSAVRNPNSPAQDARRDSVSQFSKEWFDTLTDEQRVLWETYALQQPGKYEVQAGVRELVGSNGGIMSGQNAFVMTNAWLVSAGIVPVLAPPIAVTPPSKPIGVGATSVAGVLTVTWTAPGTAVPDDVTRIWITSASGTIHKQLIGASLTDLGTAGIAVVRGAKGALIAIGELAGDRLYIQCDTVRVTGGKSGGSNTVEVFLTAAP